MMRCTLILSPSATETSERDVAVERHHLSETTKDPSFFLPYRIACIGESEEDGGQAKEEDQGMTIRQV